MNNLNNYSTEQLIIELANRNMLNSMGVKCKPGTIFAMPNVHGDGGIVVGMSCGDDKWRTVAVFDVVGNEPFKVYLYPSKDCGESEGIVIE